MSKVALVLGGAGNVGSATVRAFLQNGCCKNVIITSRDQARIDGAVAAIKETLGSDAAAKIIGVVGSAGKEDEAAELKKKVIAEVGDKLDFVVSCTGFPFCKIAQLLDVTRDQIQNVFETQFYPTFGGYCILMPLVKNAGGTYVFVTGGGPDMYLGPGTGVMTIGGSSSIALARVAMKESATDGVCCSEVSFLAGICPYPSQMPPGFTWLESAKAGEAIVSVATRRKAHASTVTITSLSDMDQVIAKGIVKHGNGAA